jgi:hypothetical protein
MKEEFYMTEKKLHQTFDMAVPMCVGTQTRDVRATCQNKFSFLHKKKKEIVQGRSSMEKGISVRLRLHPHPVP